MGKLTPREDGAPWRNFYGRRRGKTLRKGQKSLLEERLEALSVPGLAWAENPERRPIDFRALEPSCREAWLEVGFGGGEHLLAMARENPSALLLGCEPFRNGVAMCLAALEAAPLPNVRLHEGDAREVFDVAGEGAFSRIFVNYPDPWPKKRHHRRRFIGPETLPHLARIAAPGARLHVATDIPDYVRHVLEAMRAAPEFRWTAEGPEDWRRPWADWPGTRYEAKALAEGRPPHYLTFVRV